jgi:regulator of protease activity HflC (stomatin/prohibitin superfamily)
MSAGLIIAACVALLIIIMAVKGFKVVQQAETMVIERLGRYHRTLASGVNIIWPIIEKPRRIQWRYTKSGVDGASLIQIRETPRIDIRETVYDFPRQNAITKDNVALAIDALLYFQVTRRKKGCL